MRPRLFATVFLCGAWLLAASGCSSRPTFPKETLTESLGGLLDKEQLNASVRLVDHTLAIHVTYTGALTQTGNQVGLGEGFEEVSRKALPAIHRVLFSTDADVRFYVLLISDPKTPGIALTMVRCSDDIRRMDVHQIDTPEFLARTVFEVNASGPAPLTLEQYVPRDIRLGEFLSWQLARRIQQQLSQELQASGRANVGRCLGRFDEGAFTFTLDVTPQQDGGNLGEATLQEVFHSSTNLIAKVLSSYRFTDYQAVRLMHPLTGRSLQLPKARLSLFM